MIKWVFALAAEQTHLIYVGVTPRTADSSTLCGQMEVSLRSPGAFNRNRREHLSGIPSRRSEHTHPSLLHKHHSSLIYHMTQLLLLLL